MSETVDAQSQRDTSPTAIELAKEKLRDERGKVAEKLATVLHFFNERAIQRPELHEAAIKIIDEYAYLVEGK